MKAIVLSRHDFRESDQIISLYTLERGKVEVLARGVKKILSKNAAYLEPFCFVEAEIIPGKEIAHLGSVTPINIFKNIRADLDASLAAGYVVDLMDKNIHSGEMDVRMFEMVRGWLEWVDSSLAAGVKEQSDWVMGAANAFVAKFLTLLGFDPSSENGIDKQYLDILVRGSWATIDATKIFYEDCVRTQKLLYNFALRHLERKIFDWAMIG